MRKRPNVELELSVRSAALLRRSAGRRQNQVRQEEITAQIDELSVAGLLADADRP